MSPTIGRLSPEIGNSIHARSHEMDTVLKPHVPSQSLLQFDPNEINKLRSKHIRSLNDKKRGVRNKNPLARSPRFSSSLPSLTEVPSGAGRVMESLEHSSTHPHNAYAVQDESVDDTVKLEALRAMRDVVMQQQENLKAMSDQNHLYRRKLGTDDTTFHSLHKNHVNHVGMLEQLQMEKELYEAETLLLREEMVAIRQELEVVRCYLPSQPKTPSQQPTPVQRTRSRQDDQQQKLAYNAPKSQAAIQLPLRRSTKNNEVGPEIAANYWKKEWELSMTEETEPTFEPTTDSRTSFFRSPGTSESSNDGFGSFSETSRSFGGTSKSSSSVPPDPPEEKGLEPERRDSMTDEYQQDMEFVRKLLAKYEVQQKGESQSQTKGNDRNNEFDGFVSAPVASEYTEQTVQIEEDLFDIQEATERYHQAKSKGMATSSQTVHVSQTQTISRRNQSRPDASEYSSVQDVSRHPAIKKTVTAAERARFKQLAELDDSRDESSRQEGRSAPDHGWYGERFGEAGAAGSKSGVSRLASSRAYMREQPEQGTHTHQNVQPTSRMREFAAYRQQLGSQKSEGHSQYLEDPPTVTREQPLTGLKSAAYKQRFDNFQKRQQLKFQTRQQLREPQSGSPVEFQTRQQLRERQSGSPVDPFANL
jgi:hypothetical protein